MLQGMNGLRDARLDPDINRMVAIYQVGSFLFLLLGLGFLLVWRNDRFNRAALMWGIAHVVLAIANLTGHTYEINHQLAWRVVSSIATAVFLMALWEANETIRGRSTPVRRLAWQGTALLLLIVLIAVGFGQLTARISVACVMIGLYLWSAYTINHRMQMHGIALLFAAKAAVIMSSFSDLATFSTIGQPFWMSALNWCTSFLLALGLVHVAVMQSRRRLLEVIKHLPDALVVRQPDGRVVVCNDAFARLAGVAHSGDLVGQTTPWAMTHASKTGEHTVRACEFTPKVGAAFPAEIISSTFSDFGQALVIGQIRDLSSQKQHEAQYQKAAQALSESQQRLRELAAQNEATQEEERKHIAREVHDELGQVLTALRMEISLLAMHHGTRNPALTGKLTGMKALVDRAIQGVRNVAAHQRPAALDMGLVPAIEWLCSDFSERTAVPCTLHAQEDDISLDETRSVVLFRIAQESITNITRYANCTQVDVTLKRRDNELSLEVRDNGRGFDLAATSPRKSYGLLGMRERALALGGQLEIESTEGVGTLIYVKIPIQNNNAKDFS